jgi:polysaccharide export outer membrane protein
MESAGAGVAATGLQQLPPPTRADLVGTARPYLIGPFDKLEIEVFVIVDLQREVQADASGRISFPLVGSVDASGKTPEELAQAIAAGLRDRYVRDPQVTVNLKETVSQVVTVDGEVKQPGLYPVVGHMTLSGAVATAKGTTEFAKLQNVYVIRTVNGEKMVGAYNLAAIRAGRYADPEVFANDMVIVGESRARRLFQNFLGVAPAVLTPLIYALR